MSGREDLKQLTRDLRAYREFSEGSAGADWSEVEVCLRAADAIEALAAENARLSASEPKCAVVKPLRWDDGGCAELPLHAGGYVIHKAPCWARVTGHGLRMEFEENLATEKAKAAAQKHHEARMLEKITLRTEAEIRAEAWAAAIEAVLGLPKRLEPIGGQMYSYANRGEISAITPPADISAALDRIKAEVRAEAWHEVAELVRGWRNVTPMTGEECANAILAALKGGA